MQIERVIPRAKQLLSIPIDDNAQDLWLWEHAERVMHLTQSIAALPDVDGSTADLTALILAALFHDAGWISEYQQGRYQRWQLLTRPTNDIQRELGAALLQEEVGQIFSGPTLHTAIEAIRHCNNRHTDLLEAHILAEAEALDEVGVTYVLRQFRQYQAEGRPLEQLANSWQRQQEYRYWEVRLNDGFRYESTRQLARRRLHTVELFMLGIRQGLRGDDVRQLLSESGTPPAPATR